MNDWQPGATLDILRERARLNADVRSFFAAHGVLEVETPLLCSSTATDLHLASFSVATGSQAGDQSRRRFLQTSPEFAMKRLLAAGSGPVYQMCKAFRAGDSSPRHNPEFTMLEWYRPGFSLSQLMDEVDALLRFVLSSGRASPAESASLATSVRTTYRQVFAARFGVNPHAADVDVLREIVLRETTFGRADSLDAPACLDLLFAAVIEPTLGLDAPVFVFDFPATQASLAQVQVNAEGDRVAARCELYLRGMELANGYQELTSAAELDRRFAADNVARHAAGLPEIPPDNRLLDALVSGLPDCAGVALGVDRLLMIRTGATDIDQVLAFASGRA